MSLSIITYLPVIFDLLGNKSVNRPQLDPDLSTLSRATYECYQEQVWRIRNFHLHLRLQKRLLNGLIQGIPGMKTRVLWQQSDSKIQNYIMNL